MVSQVVFETNSKLLAIMVMGIMLIKNNLRILEEIYIKANITA